MQRRPQFQSRKDERGKVITKDRACKRDWKSRSRGSFGRLLPIVIFCFTVLMINTRRWRRIIKSFGCHNNKNQALSPAYEESLHFFDDISQGSWKRLKEKVQVMAIEFDDETIVANYKKQHPSDLKREEEVEPSLENESFGWSILNSIRNMIISEENAENNNNDVDDKLKTMIEEYANKEEEVEPSPYNGWSILESIKNMVYSEENTDDISKDIEDYSHGRNEKENYRVKAARWYYQHHQIPNFLCEHEERIGRLGDGGKWICDPHRIQKQESCLVYSVGSNNDFSFERGIRETIGHHCEIHTFDFGDYGAGAEAAGVSYHQWGLGGKNTWKYKTLKRSVRDLGHEGRTIDIFKIDCEGCEFDVLSSWFRSAAILRQIVVEVHHSRKTQMDMVNVNKFYKMFRDQGYVIFHREANIQHSFSTFTYNDCLEVSFLKLNRTFFRSRV